MNYSTAIFLINKHARAVKATYEAEDNAPANVFKTLDPNVSVGDYILVPTNTRHKMTVCKVKEVDVDIDLEAPGEVQWVIGIIDTTMYQQLLAQEAQAIQKIKSAELRKKRDELSKALFADHIEDLKALPISAINGDDKPAENK